MKIKKLNSLFRRLGEFQLKYRWFYLASILLVTVFCCLGLRQLDLSSSEEEWFDDWDNIKIAQDHFEDMFGADDSVMALIQADDVFDREVLEAIDKIGKRLEAEVPYAKSVTSLTELSIPQGTVEGFEIISPLEDFCDNNYSDEEIRQKKEYILSRESLCNNLVSDDAKETWIILQLENYSEPMTQAMNKIVPPARAILTSPEFQSDKFTIKPTGLSYTEYEESETTEKEISIRIGIGFCVMILCLLIFMRSLRGVIVPCIATVGAIGSVLGLNGWLKIQGDDQMVALPVLLSMALSIGYAIHYVNSFRLHFRRSGKRKQSVLDSMEESGWPIFFTVITTVAGLISFLFADIRPLRWVGGCAASCVFAVYVYVIILIPIFLSFGKDGKAASASDIAAMEGATKTDLALEKFGSKIIRRSAIVLIISLAVIAGMIPGIPRTQVNMDYTEMMGERTEFVKRLLSILRGKLGSQYSYNVLVEYEDADAFKSSENMKKLDVLSAKLGSLDTTKVSGNKPRVTSITKIIKEMNRTLNEDSPSAYVIPEDDDLLTQEMFLYEISGGDDLYDWISDDYRNAYIHIEMNGYEAKKITRTLDQVKAYANEVFPDAKTSVVGEVVNYAIMNGKLVKGELKSFLGSFVLILILMSFAFGSLHTGLIAMIPNIAPVIMIGGVMGYLGISLDMITMTTMPMILGIAVDDTIHFTNHIKFFFEKGLSYKDAVLTSYREIGKTMGMTTIILCSMFLVLSFSVMNCLARLGYLSIIGLVSALIADYTLTPVLIFLTKPFGKENKKSVTQNK
ncbi:MAG: MMPL family transporter [Treponema sp.]|nr:MMPL family transporter [Treponema sp.]